MKNRVTLNKLRQFKQQQHPIAMLTCYDFATAAHLQQADVDAVLVGDSLAQTMLGYDSTLPLSMEISIALTTAVGKGAPYACLVGDMPYMSYQPSPEIAIRNAGRFLAEANCDLVKVEVTAKQVDTIKALTTAGIPVMAHLGYRPQMAYQFDTPVQSRAAQDALQLLDEAQLMVQAGAAALLLECVTAEAAQAVTERVPVPVISCGSGPHCDGQVLVIHDVLGLAGGADLKFAKRYAEIGREIEAAAVKYCEEIHRRTFPDAEHSFHMKPDALAEFQEALARRTP